MRKKRLLQSFRAGIATLFMVLASNILPVTAVYAAENGGNEDCPVGTVQLAKYNFTGGTYVAESGGTDVTVTGTATSGSFTVVKADTTASAVVVKGGTDAKVMTYADVISGSFDNTGLVNGGGQTPDISNVKICGTTGDVQGDTDVCPNIEGSQTTVPEGMVVNNEGECITPALDVCANIEGVQTTVPEGMTVDAENNCLEAPEVPTDVCPNIEGVQTTVPEGMELDEADNCVTPPTDLCPNVPGAQGVVPAGLVLTNSGDCKVIICHRTAAVQNPYVRIEVAVDSVDGDAGNDNGQGDHFLEHTGPVFNDTMVQGDSWGDIIPAIPGIHDGLNWDTEGQAVYNADCATPTPPEVTDLCPNIEGVQTEVPVGQVVDTNGNCITPGRGGDVLGIFTTKVTPVVAGQGQGTVLGATLVNTGSSALLNLFAGLFILGITGVVTIMSRKGRNGTAVQALYSTSAAA